MKKFRGISPKLAYVLFLVIAVCLLLEVAYRYQVIDFYEPEFKALNSSFGSQPSNSYSKKILVIGDSFSASAPNYVDNLRKANPEFHILNAAVPGTGVRQQKLILKKRIRDFTPDIIIYQIYVGNDFTDVLHPINFSDNSILRNVYWYLSDRVLVLPYLNRRLATLKKGSGNGNTVHADKFSIEKYNRRSKLYLEADSKLLGAIVNYEHRVLERYNLWNELTNEMMSMLSNSAQVYFLLIPHCSQVSKSFQNNWEELGAEFTNNIQNPEYPLIRRMKKDFPDVNFLNPLRTFQESNNPDSLYYRNDPHLSRYGQQVLGNFINQTF